MLLLAVLFAFAKLPKIDHGDQQNSLTSNEEKSAISISSHRHLLLGAIAIFLYVGAEVSIGSFLINFLEQPQVANITAAEAGSMSVLLGRRNGWAIHRFCSHAKSQPR